MKKRSGFTLIELIVVIAILGILALFLVPSFIGYAKDAQQATCEGNMNSIQRAYYFQMARQGSGENSELLEKVLKNEFNDFSSVVKCSAGGVYSIVNHGVEGAPAFRVVCSKHSNELGTIPTQVLNQMLYFVNDVKNMEIDSEEFNKYYELYQASVEKPGDRKYFKEQVLNNNSRLRQFLKYINNDEWPTLEANGNKFYVQPYLDSYQVINGRVPSGDVFVYASTGENWNAEYIYDNETGKWWTGKNTISIANKSFNEVKKKMQENGWSEVNDPHDMVISGQIVMP